MKCNSRTYSCVPSNIHYCDVIMGAMVSQITSISSVCSTVCSCADKKNQSSASLAFVREIHRWPVNSPHKWPVTQKSFHLMTSSCTQGLAVICIVVVTLSALNRLWKEFSHIILGCSRGTRAILWLSSYDWSSHIEVNVKDVGEIGHETTTKYKQNENHVHVFRLLYNIQCYINI